MTWAGIALFTLVAVAMILARHPIAEVQMMVMGGRVGGPGCVVAQAVVLLLLALLVFLFRDLLA